MERLHQIFTNPGDFCNLLQQPDITIEAVLILRLNCWSTLFTIARQLLNLAQIPRVWKNKLSSVLRCCGQVVLSGYKFIAVINSSPMNTTIDLFPCLRIYPKRLGAGITVSVDGV